MGGGFPPFRSVSQHNIEVLLHLNESRPACRLLPALGRAWEWSRRSAYNVSPPEYPHTLWLYAPCACKWHRYAGRSRRGKSSGRDSRRCRSSLLSLGVMSCGLARPAGTDSRMWSTWLGERAGKPAIPPEHIYGCHGLAHGTTHSTDWSRSGKS